MENVFQKLFKSRGANAGGGEASGKAKTRRVPIPSRREVLALRPVRNPVLQWEETDGRIILRARRDKARGWKARLTNVFVSLPEEHVVELDDIGSEVWRQIDGKHSMADIVDSLAKSRKLEKREAELSLQQFFKELMRRGYVGFLDDK